ncbi:hypothetical protein NL676_033181, partial [Syzygium grande]
PSHGIIELIEAIVTKLKRGRDNIPTKDGKDSAHAAAMGGDAAGLETPLYRDALLEHKKRYGSDKVKAWEDALAEAGSLSGWDMGFDSLPHFIRELVEGIVVKLKKINIVMMERSKMKELPLPMEKAEKLEELHESQSREKEEARMKDEAKEPVALIGNSYRKSPHVAKEYLGIMNSVSRMPLLIEVIGSLLYRKVVEERTAIEELILQFGLDIEEILMISYEELSLEHREIFLDIACLPADVDRRIASFMWHNPHCPPSDGVDALHFRSLVKIGKNNELGMHRLLREFGQQIIQKEDRLDPGRRGRLCNLELALNTQNMEGSDHLNFVAEDFKSMPNIRFLILDCATVGGDFANVFPNLKWLQWQGCNGDFKATNFHVEKLVILDLSWSKVTEDWGGWREIK